MPAPPAVDPPASSRSIASRIVAFSAPDVGGSTRPGRPGVHDDRHPVLGRSSCTSARNACLTSGSLSGDFIEPDTSIRKTRLLGGRSRVGTRRAWRPIRTSRCSGAHGHGPTSVETAKGWRPLRSG